MTQRIIRALRLLQFLLIVGGLTLFAGISLNALGAFLPFAPSDIKVNNSSTVSPKESSDYLMQHFGVTLALVGAIMVIIEIGYTIMFYGLLKGRGWAWTITVTVIFIGIGIQ